MKYEWDVLKSLENKKKHGISFEEAVEVFEDPFLISLLDKRFDYYEERWITIGSVRKHLVIVIGHMYCVTEDGKEFIRIITARKATGKEIEEYEKS